ncbi:MAG: hypothetical protein OHK0029_05500 [Armatimonadaceae bacterium]
MKKRLTAGIAITVLVLFAGLALIGTSLFARAPLKAPITRQPGNPTTPSLQKPWKTDDVLVILHRSASMAAPENTVPALEAAVKQEADGIEIDIRRTRDGHYVLYHDDWLLEDYGPGSKLEDLTLIEARTLDVGKRFGPQWRGLHPPLLGDVLRFARANNLRLFLDIKTPGIYEDVLSKVRAADCFSLVMKTGGQVPKDNYAQPIPFIEGWNYTGGGEEDPATIAAALKAYRTEMPTGTFAVMADDARSWSQVLNRHPERRPFVPFAYTRLTGARRGTPSKSNSTNVPTLLRRAEAGKTTKERQDALWELGTQRPAEAIPILEKIARTPLPEKIETNDFDTVFLKFGGAAALARYQTEQARTALARFLDSTGTLDRGAAALALACFGNESDLPTLITLVSPDKRNDGFPADSVLNYIGRFGDAAIPVYLAALARDGYNAKQAVFGLANRGTAALPGIRSLIYDATASEKVRRRAALALRWMEDDPDTEKLREAIRKDDNLPDSVLSALMP